MDDMMSLEERIAIRDAARCLKKYGSTSNYSSKRLDRYIKHRVKETDTLQGLALKYGVTMEDIRRANRLWANDSLFLREWLLIPSEEGEVMKGSDSPDQQRGATGGGGPATLREDSPADFLVRIDCAIASTKSSVLCRPPHSLSMGRRREENADEEVDSPENGDTELRSRPPHRGGQQQQPEVLVRSHAGRKVRTSLQRLQREADEIFEL